MSKMKRRIGYVSGPIDAAEVYDQWHTSEGSDYYGTIYLLQLYEVVDRIGAEALIITTLPTGRWETTRSNVDIVNLPMPESVGGIRYHVAMVGWTCRCMAALIRFRADAVVLTAGQNYFWAFSFLKLSGMRLIASLHCTLWPPYARRKRSHRALNALNGHLFYPFCDHIQAVSDEAARQIRQTASRLRSVPERFLPTYDPGRFVGLARPIWPQTDDVFQLLYVGRLTENKGVFDLVRVMELLQLRHPDKFRLNVCGTGPVEGELRAAIRRKGLDGLIQIHGQCVTSQLQEFYAKCHAVIVPTRSDFEEGANKVAFEAAINYRPIVMSAACPALADVLEATQQARVDDAEDYASAILRLASDRQLYESKVQGAATCRSKFFDDRYSYATKLSPSLLEITRTEDIRP